MNKENYQKQLEQIMKNHALKGEVPTVLLHSCCAPCSSYCLLYLTEGFHIIDLYYNPNIYPPLENEKRSLELKRLIEAYQREGRAVHEITYVNGTYDPQEFFRAVKGLEQIPEGGARCAVCFRMRLTETAKMAKELGADYFATTLTISPLKNADVINRIGREIAAEYGVAYLATDFKKKNGYLQSVALSQEYDLYRQDYCGCVFSKMQREKQLDKEADYESISN